MHGYTENECSCPSCQKMCKTSPCLGRDADNFSWRLCYSNGDGKFIWSSENELDTFEQVQVLDVNNLPKY